MTVRREIAQKPGEGDEARGQRKEPCFRPEVFATCLPQESCGGEELGPADPRERALLHSHVSPSFSQAEPTA